jgi:antitoxin (DNA-binding transcriptional repressor) of toxin-antitoxin stability system
MKTVTVRQLRNEFRTCLAWVEAGEVVKISRRGKIIARLELEKPKPRKVDWTKSAAFTADRTGWTKLSAKQVRSILDYNQG